MPDTPQFNLELVRRFNLWLMAQKYRPYTEEYYKYTARHFSAFLGNKSATKVTYVDVLEYLAALAQEGKSIYTLHHYLHGLRIFYDFLDFGGLIAQHAPRMVRMKAIRPKVPAVINEKQMVRLIAAAKTPRDRLIAELLYATGCRGGELGRIKVEDIDFDGHKIRVLGKGNKPRFVLFGTPAKRAIRAYLKGRQSGYLIEDGMRKQKGTVAPSGYGGAWALSWRVYSAPHRYKQYQHYIPAKDKASRREACALLKKLTKDVDLSRPPRSTPKTPSCIWDAVKGMAARAGMPWICPQIIRHTFATHLLDHNANLRVIQHLMGHNSGRTTEIYTHVSRVDLRKPYDHCHPRAKG